MPPTVPCGVAACEASGLNRNEGGPLTLVLRIGLEDWGRCRFAVSPLHETAAGLRLLVKPGGLAATAGLPWAEGLADLDREAYAPLLALMPHPGWGVDFLTPPPAGPAGQLDDELARVAGTDPAQVAAEVTRCRQAQGLPPDGEDPQRRRDQLVGLLRRAWDEWLGPHWPRLRDVWRPTSHAAAPAPPAAGWRPSWSTCHRRSTSWTARSPFPVRTSRSTSTAGGCCSCRAA
jgi:hypothetical protein